MPRKNNTEKNSRGTRRTSEVRTPRPKPKIDFTIDALDYKNVNLLKQFVTDQGRILPRKYTGLPAHYQRRLTNSITRAGQLLLLTYVPAAVFRHAPRRRGRGASF